MSSSLIRRLAASLGGMVVALVMAFILIPAHPAAAASIQDQINAAPDGGTINLAIGTFVESLTVNKTLTLTGVSSATTILHAAPGQRVITVTAGHNLRLVNLAITGGHPASDVGGGIYVIGGGLTLVNTRIADNSAAYGGGVFQSGAGGVNISGSRIEHNTTPNHGGGLYVSSGGATLTDTLVFGNSAQWHGGGLHVNSGTTRLSGGEFHDNTAQFGNGGAVNSNADVLLDYTKFVSNSAQFGGAVTQWNKGYLTQFYLGTFEGNRAAQGGGAAYISGTLNIYGTTFYTNTVADSASNTGSGGGIFAGCTAQVWYAVFVGNAACSGCPSVDGGGGAIYASQPLTVESSIFMVNRAKSGGGIYGSRVVLTVSTFISNQASAYGGAVGSVFITVTHSVFQGSQADYGGGALYGAVLNLSRVWLTGNRSAYGWGGAVHAASLLDAGNVLIVDNTSANGSAVDIWHADLRLHHATIASAARSGGLAIFLQANCHAAITNTIISNYTVGLHMLNNVDPRFLNPAAGDYHISAGSPAIDSGTNLGIALDLDGYLRPQGNGYDIGAYEFQWRSLFLPLIRR